MIYIQLFLSFVQIGLFSVGGGYAAIPLIQSQVVETHGWLTMNEFTNLITIAEMTPGPIGVNSATFTGLQIAGIPGAIAATIGRLAADETRRMEVIRNARETVLQFDMDEHIRFLLSLFGRCLGLEHAGTDVSAGSGGEYPAGDGRLAVSMHSDDVGK